MSSPESCVFHKDNFNLNATYGVVILSDKSFAALQHFVQIISAAKHFVQIISAAKDKCCEISTIKARFCIYCEMKF